MFISFIVVLLFTLFLVDVHGGASEEYTVKEGDTLWDISGSKLQDHFLWPKLWKANPQIKNPDLIYPGEKIKIPMEEELRRLELPVERRTPIVKKVSPAPKPETTVKIKKERPTKYIIDKNLYIASGWIADDFSSIGQIIASPTDRVIFGNHDIVYLSINRKMAEGEKFLVIRDIKTVKHPKTGKKLGHQIRVAGILKVTGTEDDTPIAKIISAFEEVQLGDGILPFQDMEPPVVPDVTRMPDIEGYIVESRMNNKVVSTGDIIYLDKGMNDGLEVGDIFGVFSTEPLIKRPIGTIQVVSLKPETSVAIVLGSEKEILIGDMWGMLSTY